MKKNNRNLISEMANMDDLDLLDDTVYDDGLGEWHNELSDLLTDVCDETIHLAVGPRYLNQVDYTLNSPLIADTLDSFLSYISGSRFDLIHHKGPRWEKARNWVRSLDVRAEDYKKSSDFHKWVFTLFQCDVQSSDFRSFIDKVDDSSRQSFEVVRSFLKGWAGMSTSYTSIKNMKCETAKYGQIFFDLYKIIILLNCSSDQEKSALLKLPNVSFNSESNTWTIFTASLGQVHIGYDMVIVPTQKLMMTRNMALMVKDTALARFQTLMNIQTRKNPGYSIIHLQAIVNLYKAGDDLFKKHGNQAFDCIKMLEPLSINKIDEMSRETIPLIPEFTSFPQFLEAQKKALREIYPEFYQFSECIRKQNDLRILLTSYGAFRHWGHPFIDYFTGLEALHHNTTLVKNIDKAYAGALASDLTRKILTRKFKTESKWYVDLDQLPGDHTFYTMVKNNTWPSLGHIEEFGDHWHELPLVPCFVIPDVIDPSLIYADKSHSPNFSEVLDHVKKFPNKPIQSKKVLMTFLESPATEWKGFLQRVDRRGFEHEELIIGLTGKEREIKWKGRFFALMSWALREYFVITEYLIKEHILPFFEGITMADDQTTITRKMLDRTRGQGKADYKTVTIANHIDYEKWNNHQRGEANNPVFRVMGQFLGYPHLIERTHEVFEKSLFYYRDRPDLMKVEDGDLCNKTDKRVCWRGQAGGIEGLRQKGWSVVNLLAVERNSRIRNTDVSALAQGDNQVIITKFLVADWRNEAELKGRLKSIINNNASIMDSITEGTGKLGLIINKEETLQSASMLVYGKNIIFHGCMLGLEEKRYSRVTCMTNDQLPTMGNMLSTVTTNCLTVAHQSKDPVNAMIAFNWQSNFTRELMLVHNPALRCSPDDIIQLGVEDSRAFNIIFAYLDPSLGGIGGMSLTRFLIRQFPDPVSEALAFWKIIYANTSDPALRRIATSAGNPKLGAVTTENFKKLVEAPESLNIPSSISAKALIREEIRKQLIWNNSEIKNEIVARAVRYTNSIGTRFIAFLESIKPCFPRFLNEFSESTYNGMVEKLIGLFENARTIRTTFQKRLGPRVDAVIVASEISSIRTLVRIATKRSNRIWDCSSKQADDLRLKSWRREIIGATVPHPVEMIGDYAIGLATCGPCRDGGRKSGYVVAVIPSTFDPDCYDRGTHSPYLGSHTSESTSLVQAWEKDTNLPTIRRAAYLRNVINWFVQPDSNLAKSIINNLEALTGESADVVMSGFERTGSARHRYACSRVSNGGFLAQSPFFATWMTLSTDPLNKTLDMDMNYDFMFQSCLVYAQGLAGVLYRLNPQAMRVHCHVKCLSCIRPIEELQLESNYVFEFPSVSATLENWKPSGTPWLKKNSGLSIERGNWAVVSDREKSYHIGVAQGFLFGEWYNQNENQKKLDDLFPYTIHSKVIPKPYLKGIATGLARAGALSLVHRKSVSTQGHHWELLSSNFWARLDNLICNESFLKIIQNPAILSELLTVAHRISPSFPTNSRDLGMSVTAYLKTIMMNTFVNPKEYNPLYKDTWLFSDCLSPETGGLMMLSTYAAKVIMVQKLGKPAQDAIRSIADLARSLRSKELFDQTEIIHIGRILFCPSEVRHSCKGINNSQYRIDTNLLTEFTEEYKGDVSELIIPTTMIYKKPPVIDIPRIQQPVVSGLRTSQIATGSHMKLGCILKRLNRTFNDAICTGDGSGGWGSRVIREYRTARIIFNSLMSFEHLQLNGVSPSPPSAIYHLGESIVERCPNLHEAWENPSDLRDKETWDYFVEQKRRFDLVVDLITLDLESSDLTSDQRVLRHLFDFLPRLLHPGGVVIYKTYIVRLLDPAERLLERFLSRFNTIRICQTELSSSFTSEVYIIGEDLNYSNNLDRYPDWSLITPFIQRCYCFQSIDFEFQRARRLATINLSQGVPPTLIPKSDNEISGLLIRLTIPHHHAIIVGQLMNEIDPMDGPAYCIYLLGIIGLFGFKVCTKDAILPHLPSDQIVGQSVAMIMGINIWISLVWNDRDLFKSCHNAINQTIPVYCDRKASWNYKTKKPRYALQWSFKNETKERKYIRLDSRMALIGATVRTLQNQFPQVSRPFSKDLVNQWFSRHQLGLTIDTLMSRTGSFEYLGC
ncbi:MAG: putative RNA-dependent RNA polymerase [Hattula rhabdovirus]|uniref:Replicase n=1 Tax=Hattula rhabdovirus TaxID=2980578 RepID=A0AAE9T8P1_9RHAB|nr:MAG: putative RNA-dependent RNA polymerase [Hattula rhabdovirus]